MQPQSRIGPCAEHYFFEDPAYCDEVIILANATDGTLVRFVGAMIR